MGSDSQQGLFTVSQWSLSINTKELLAIYYGLVMRSVELRSKHMLICSDSTTALSCLRKRGSWDPLHNRITQRLFQVVFDNDIFISQTHVRGEDNILVDRASRKFEAPNLNMHWTMPQVMVDALFASLPSPPDIDLFASSLNHRLPCFCSYRPCDRVYRVDCFTLDWSKFNGYVFTPPVLIPKILHKIVSDCVSRIFGIWPVWETVEWWATFLQLVDREPTLLPQGAANQLYLPWDQFREVKHPLRKGLRLLFASLSHCPSKPPTLLQAKLSILQNSGGVRTRSRCSTLHPEHGFISQKRWINE